MDVAWGLRPTKWEIVGLLYVPHTPMQTIDLPGEARPPWVRANGFGGMGYEDFGASYQIGRAHV